MARGPKKTGPPGAEVVPGLVLHNPAASLLAKSSWLDTTNSECRQILQQFTLYNCALSTNLPFPKARWVVFLNNRPAPLPGGRG